MQHKLTVDLPNNGGTVTVTHAAWELTIEHYAHMTLGNLRDAVNERVETEYKFRSWTECMAILADLDHNVEGSPFGVTK